LIDRENTPSLLAGFNISHKSLFSNQDLPINFVFPELTSLTVHKVCISLRTKKLCNSDLWYLSCASDFGKMPRRRAAELARDKARKQVQNLFDKFKDPDSVYGGYLLKIDGTSPFDDKELTSLHVKLLPFDVSDKPTSNFAPSFFKPWSVSKLEDHPVDAKAMKGDGLEALEIGDPIPSPSNSLSPARQVEDFIDGQYFHVPRANLGRGLFETLSDHSRWCPVS
jgi:hypothetical protein